MFWKGKTYKSPQQDSNSWLTIFVVDALIYCATLLGNNFGKEKVILDFIVISTRRTSHYGGVPYQNGWGGKQTPLIGNKYKK